MDIRGRGAGAGSGTTVPGPTTNVPISDAQVKERLDQIANEQKAYSELGSGLLRLVKTIFDLPFHLAGWQNIFSITSNDDKIIARGKLDLLFVFLSGYLLPMLYGLLGACAFVLRQLSEVDKPTYVHDARVSYSLPLNIGLLSGLAVGWFIKPGSGDAGLANLSPLALAFVAGYGSDLFFAFLNKIIEAFAPSSQTTTTTTREP